LSWAADTRPWPDAILGVDTAFERPHDAHLRVVDTEEVIHLPVRRWHQAVAAQELRVLDGVRSPVLDVGCGPGRHAAALAQAGHVALGIDTSPAAVRAARRRGANAVTVSVFGPVPYRGRWATALLLDGNIGIGGDPARLLRRVHGLLTRRGRVLVEVDPPGFRSRRFHARVQMAGHLGPGFPWACVSATGIGPIAAAAGFETISVWSHDDRWFAYLRKRAQR
jgi:SAM-dependent methyltransferase